jgi:hypothetical protein|tara:strand:+ start:835 stop:4815 length:3981 start_codon:yes stop_codon:yes gene_type:complete
MACTDVQTIQAGNGSKTQFSFDFPYIFKSEIHVYFWNVVTKEYDEKLTTDATYPWQITDANPTIVEFTGTAPPAPTSPTDPGEPTVDNVKIRRITKVEDIRALFNPGSAIRSDDLNKNFEQLRYAIQEANCAGIPDDVDAYLKNYYWNKFDSTVYSTETWDSDDDQVATTQAIDARIDAKVDSALTVDIVGADGVNITDNSPNSGQITVGLSDNAVDFDKIKDADQIKLADQVADYDNGGSDDKVFTSLAAIRRFENFVQDATPSTTAGIGKGAVWLDVADDKTLSMWDGSAWQAITSGGTFSNQPKVVYVDASSGSDSNDGHRISRPKKTIKAAINQINADSTYGDGSVVIVAAGVYQEVAPIQIQKKNVSIVGQALRSCIVHPTVATQGDQSTGNHALFELNSGSFIQNLTLTGMKAGSSGTNSLDSSLPAAQGWNFAFYAGATIVKSPYIQNCTNFSDSEIDNSNLNANTPAGGLAGDTDSAATGGGMLVDGSVVAAASPLRSMVADSYTHVGLNGPGILVTNNGYTQCTSSYAFFNKYHIKVLNGGQANLAASTTDFGDEALVADGKSTTAIFTSNVDGAAADGDKTFNINEPTAGSGWFGDTQRPASNMLVTVNGNTYPVLSATANTDSEGGNGWTVTIQRPNPNKKSENLGLDGAVSDNAAVSFFLRSMIASSGHTMEYVGSGTNYNALPENGGVPNDSKQIVESNDGKVWTAITDHNGKFKIGDFFEVDQRKGFINFSAGSYAFDVVTDANPQLGGPLDVNGQEITSASNGNITINPAGTGQIVLDANVKLPAGTAASPSFYNGTDTNTGLYFSAADEVSVTTGGTQRFVVDSSGRVLINRSNSTGSHNLEVHGGTDNEPIKISSSDAGAYIVFADDDTTGSTRLGAIDNDLKFDVNSVEQLRIDSSGNVLFKQEASSSYPEQKLKWSNDSTTTNGFYISQNSSRQGKVWHEQGLEIVFGTNNAEQMRIDSSGRLLVGTDSSKSAGAGQYAPLNVQGYIGSSAGGGELCLSRGETASSITANDQLGAIVFTDSAGYGFGSINCKADAAAGSSDYPGRIEFKTAADGSGSMTERMRINSAGHVMIGTDTEGYANGADNFTVANSGNCGITIRSGSSDQANIYFSDGTSSSDEYEGIVQYLHQFDDMSFGVNNGVERLRLLSTGKVRAPGVYNLTTTTGGAVYVQSDGDLLRYTSSLKYKTDVETIEDARADAILNCRPVWYRSTCESDITTEGAEKSDWGWYGFIAEEVAEVEPRLVNWATKDAVQQENRLIESVQRDPADYTAEGVRYENFVPLLVNLVKRQQARIETLEAKVAALEAG